jgi:hypothetical protein
MTGNLFGVEFLGEAFFSLSSIFYLSLVVGLST